MENLKQTYFGLVFLEMLHLFLAVLIRFNGFQKPASVF